MLTGIALRWVTQGQFPLAANKSSAGLMNPPLLEYLLAVPLFLKQDLLVVAQFVALVNVAAIGVTFFVLRMTFGVRLAVLATLLYAVSPWSVYYSRLIWNPSPIPLFSALLLGSLLATFTGGRPWHLALAFVWLAAAIQLHLGSIALAPALGVLLVIFRKRVTLKWLLAGVLLFVLSFAPYLLYQQATGFADVAGFLQGGLGPSETNLASASIGVELAGERGIARTVGDAWRQWRAAAPWGEELRAWTPWLLPAGLISAGALLLRRRDEFRARQLAPATVGLVVAVVLFAVPILLNVSHTIYLQNYYFLYLYPVLFIFMALPAGAALDWTGPRLIPSGASPRLVLSEAGRFKSNRQWVMLPILLLPTLLILLAAARHFYFYSAGLQLISQGVLGGQQIRHVQSAIDTLADFGRQHPDCDLMIASDGFNANSSALGQVGEFLAPRPVRYVRLGSGVIVPQSCSYTLVASGDSSLRAWYDAHMEWRPDRAISLPNDAWHFYEMTPARRAAFVASLKDAPALGEWDNGARLRRVDRSGALRRGSSLELRLTWEVRQETPQREYHFFSHLLDKDGNLIAQADGPGVYSAYWQPGEFFVTWFEIPVPGDAAPGDYRLALGLYEWPSLVRSRLTDGGDSLALGVVQVSD